MNEEGPSTVVLCGSLGSTAELWGPQRATLAGRRVVVVELPGHGAAPPRRVSEVADLVPDVLDAAGEDSFAFVGLSFGGAVGMRLAIDHPRRVERLVLASTAKQFDAPVYLERAALVRAEGLEPVVDGTMRRWFTPEFGDVDRFREMLLSVDAESYACCCEAIARWDARDVLAAITAPTLVIGGAEDPSTPPADAQAIVSEIPGARLEIVDRAAHIVNVERADAFNRLLEAHL